jgi:hypothetical protein
MANARYKKSEDEDISEVVKAVDEFDLDAPAGTYQLDHVAEQLRSCIRSADPQRATRLMMLRCCRRSLQRKHHDEVVHPKQLTTAQQLIEGLSSIVDIERRISKLDREHLSTILHRYPDADEGDDGYSPSLMILKIDDEAAGIIDMTRKLSDSISGFLDQICVPEFVKDGNRSVPFTRGLITETAAAWFSMVGLRPNREDVPDLSKLVFATLKDFQYPLQRSQRNSIIWLTDRIRKQIFWN